MNSRLCSAFPNDRGFPALLGMIFSGIPRLYCRMLSGNPLTEAELAKAIAKSWRLETSDDPLGWSCRNPSHGQCAVTALIVQDFLGGELLCARVNLTAHYWNLLPNGRELDLTREQFTEVAFRGMPSESTRQFVLSFSNTRRNYKRLRKIVLAALYAQSRRIKQSASAKS